MFKMFFPPVLPWIPYYPAQIPPQPFAVPQVDVFDSIRRGNCDEVQLAISSGKVHVNHKNVKGETLLIAAICYRQLEIAKHLIFLGADLEIPDPFGKSARDYIQEQKIHQLYNINKIIESFQSSLVQHDDLVEVAGEHAEVVSES